MPKSKGRKNAKSEPLKDNLKDSYEVQKSTPLFSLWKSELTLESRAVLPKETQIEGQLTFSESPDFEAETIEEPDTEELMTQKYGSDALTFFAGSMDYEFSKHSN